MADLEFLEGRGDFRNPTRTERVWAYWRIVCVYELGQISLFLNTHNLI